MDWKLVSEHEMPPTQTRGTDAWPLLRCCGVGFPTQLDVFVQAVKGNSES